MILNRRMRAWVVFTGVAAMMTLGKLAMPDYARAQTAYTLVQSQDGMELKTPDGRVIFQYMTKRPDNVGLTSPSVAIFHPVETPSGETITALAPNDHPHHRGIFFGFMNSEFHTPVNFDKSAPTHPIKAFNVLRADFWAWGEYAPREGRLIQNRDVKLVSSDSKHAQLEIHNDWLVQERSDRSDSRKMLDETDEVFASERDGVYVIDIYYRLAPVVEYELLRTGFGGFDVQAQKYGDSYYSTAAGKVTLPDPHFSYPESDWPSEPWYDYTIKLKSDGKTIGVAVVDHPLNPPTRWQNSRTLWMLNPCITTFGPVTIEPDAPMVLRYRVVVHDGPTPTEEMQKLAQEFRGMQLDPFVHQ